MPPKKAMTRGMGKDSGSLREKLQGFMRDPDNPDFVKFRQAADSVMEKVRKSYAYDYASSSTQNRRALHLAEYIDVVKSLANLAGEAEPEGEDWENRLWGKDHVQDNLNAYVIFIAQFIQPRAFDSVSIKFNTLAQRRQSLMYWVMQKCDDKVISIKDIWNLSNKALHMAFREHNLTTADAPKLYANKTDMAQLIEHVTYADGNVENAQQHVIAWLLGFICGVRPGTIGAAKNRPNQFLCWDDIAISRLADGNLQVIILFKWLKGFRDERLKPLRFLVSGPLAAEDVMFSLPHRLLALAFRRGIIRDFKTVDEFLASNRTKVTFKPEFLKSPVILAGEPKGLKLIPNKPATSNALTVFLKRVAFDFGLGPDVSMYLWRRSMGTNTARVLGADKARGSLGHEMSSKTFESAYEQGTIGIDVMNLAMGNQLQSAGDLLQTETLSVNRIRQSVNNKAKWTKQYVQNHAEYRKHNEELQKAELNINVEGGVEKRDQARQYFDKTVRTLNRQAAIAFQKMELELVQERMTVEEMRERQKDLQAVGKFEARLREAAEEARAEAENENGAPIEQLEPEDLRDVREDANELEEGEDEEQVAQDLVDDASNVIRVNGLSGERDWGTTRRDPNPEVEQKAIAAALRLLIQLLVEQKGEDASQEFNCPSCVVDPTVPNDLPADLPKGSKATQFKNKLYKRGELNQHLSGDYHSPVKKWYRQMGSDANIRCPYDPDWNDCQYSGTAAQILAHVHRTTKQSDAHLLNAARAGLFARDFNPAEGRTVGGLKGKGKAGEGVAYQGHQDPDEFDLQAFVPASNISIDGDVEPNEAAPYAKTVRLPPKADLVDSTLYKEFPEGVHGRVADVLQAQRAWHARRGGAGLQQHNTEQSVQPKTMGATQTRAGKNKGKRKVEGIAELRERLSVLNFDWAGNSVDVEDDGGDDEDGENGQESLFVPEAEAS